MNGPLAVTLTGTTNKHVQTPQRGILELSELGVHGALVTAVFRRLLPDGRLAAPVTVAEPRFTYDPRTDAAIGRARFVAEAADAAGWPVYRASSDDPGELGCPDCGEPLRLIITGAVGHSGTTCSTTNPFAPTTVRPDCGSREALHEAILAAAADQGSAGAAVEDIEQWIADNRSGGPVPRQVLLARIAELTDADRLEGLYGPAVRKWFPKPVGVAARSGRP